VLRTVPDGEYVFWDYVDDDLVSPYPVRLRLKATFRDGQVELDATGTDPQVGAAFNYPSEGSLRSGFTRRLVTFICTHDKTIPFNAGIFRPFSAVIPRGVILHAEFPDAISCRVDTTRRFNDVVNGVLLQAAPDKMAAPAGGASVTLVLSEPDRSGNGSPIVNVLQSLRGGMGAFRGNDGVDGRDVSYINMKNQRLETIETNSAVRIVTYDVRPDSGGPGCWRGGVGQLLAVEVLKDDCTLIIQGADRLRFRGWGVFGGKPAAPFTIIVKPKDGPERRLAKIDRVTVNAGDVVTVLMPGGSGYGDPLTRDTTDVLNDVRRGFVTLDGAARDYGVVIAGDAVDVEATLQARERERRNSVPTFDFGEERELWERVFDDRTMVELNRRLLKLPKAMRQPLRRRIFERVVPGLSKPGEGSLADAIGDPTLAADRLAAAMGELLPAEE
jgi:N-methylhydantoinase B